jgi:N-acetylmuramoyl-L-alanine amidase
VPLYEEGDRGEAVRDIQSRLAALGFSSDPDLDGVFGPGTRRAVEEFQRSRNLAVDGLVGRETWRILVDAGFTLGDRLLYHKMPTLHGDDVAALQRDLNALGFDPEYVDGVFGPATLRAVMDFQQNRHMAEDGIVGPEFVEELTLMVRATRKAGRDVLRERVWLNALPSRLAGQHVFVDPFCRDDHEAALTWDAAIGAASGFRELGAIPVLSRSADTRPPERLRASQANQAAADMVISFALPGNDISGVYYFCSSLTRSEAGEALAAAVGARLGLPPVGRVMPILSETRAPAIVVGVPTPSARVGRGVARGIESWLSTRSDQDPKSAR